MVFLAGIVLINVNDAREKAKRAEALAQVNDLQKAMAVYFNDVGTYPSACELDCTAASDPLLNDLGVSGWSGPYSTLWNLAHPWRGHIGFQYADFDSDGITDAMITLDDDLPSTDTGNNQGVIPTESLTRLDEILDDGDLSTGRVRGNGGFGSAFGELRIKINF